MVAKPCTPATSDSASTIGDACLEYGPDYPVPDPNSYCNGGGRVVEPRYCGRDGYATEYDENDSGAAPNEYEDDGGYAASDSRNDGRDTALADYYSDGADDPAPDFLDHDLDIEPNRYDYDSDSEEAMYSSAPESTDTDFPDKLNLLLVRRFTFCGATSGNAANTSVNPLGSHSISKESCPQSKPINAAGACSKQTAYQPPSELLPEPLGMLPSSVNEELSSPDMPLTAGYSDQPGTFQPDQPGSVVLSAATDDNFGFLSPASDGSIGSYGHAYGTTEAPVALSPNKTPYGAATPLASGPEDAVYGSPPAPCNDPDPVTLADEVPPNSVGPIVSLVTDTQNVRIKQSEAAEPDVSSDSAEKYTAPRQPTSSLPEEMGLVVPNSSHVGTHDAFSQHESSLGTPDALLHRTSRPSTARLWASLQLRVQPIWATSKVHSAHFPPPERTFCSNGARYPYFKPQPPTEAPLHGLFLGMLLSLLGLHATMKETRGCARCLSDPGTELDLAKQELLKVFPTQFYVKETV
ncbi:hypothetical protein PLESTB_001747100 [Pleodorina starrii]|uniref:Uncharacterized protein n=1 Tax=Pleodorina starrii TaxID=330485 RepID=A0A9W6C0Q1_9CHLO|nr:hypothetical protein PLESTM_001672200 [Pleodorina starrii]GLC61357.1 hypothetical protein PLESTB_001747100 [Pleodorina starrii]GLC69331.1 hypothetical protein PLESTF_000817700 [Pleodorina starrii]